MNEAWKSIQRAPKQERGGRIMSAKELGRWLSIAVIDLALLGKEITVESLKENRPELRVYKERFSVLPTYCGAGRSNDGLGLHRIGRKGPWSPSKENAVLAVQWWLRNGYTEDELTDIFIRDTWEELEADIDALKPHASFLPQPAAPPSPPAPPSLPVAGASATSGPEDEEEEEEDEELVQRLQQATDEAARQRAIPAGFAGGRPTTEDADEAAPKKEPYDRKRAYREAL